MKAALIVPVPELAAVDAHRVSMDPAHRFGVPPHVTVIFPFALPEECDVDLLSDAVDRVPAFVARFTRVDWFGKEVMWLGVEDEAPFRGLTDEVYATFPDFAPYGGAYAEVVPHLTVGCAPPATPAQLGAAADELGCGLPREARIHEVHYGVLTDAPGSWTVLHRFALGRS